MTGRIFTYQEHIVTPGNWWPRCRWNLKQAKCQENQTGKCFNLSSNHQSSINIRKGFQFRVFAYSSCNKCLISICVYSVIQAASSLSQSVINRRSTHRQWGKTSSPRDCVERRSAMITWQTLFISLPQTVQSFIRWSAQAHELCCCCRLEELCE